MSAIPASWPQCSAARTISDLTLADIAGEMERTHGGQPIDRGLAASG